MNPSGIRCWIFRSNLGDCSNLGLSSRLNSVTLIMEGGGPVEPTTDTPAVRLVRRKIWPGEIYVHAEPVAPCRPGALRMAGGTFIHTCDARFRETVGHSYPVSLHDREEGGLC